MTVPEPTGQTPESTATKLADDWRAVAALVAGLDWPDIAELTCYARFLARRAA